MGNIGENMIKIGINDYMDDETYHNDREFISSSGLKLMCPIASQYDPRKFYKTYIENEKSDKKSDALALGHYAHSLILEPETVEEKYAIYTGKTRSGKAWIEFQEENEGKTILTSSQANMIDSLYDTYKNEKVVIGAHGYDQPVELASFFKKGVAEMTVGAEINGVKVKVRTDYFREFSNFASIQDVKTTRHKVGTPFAAKNVCDELDYDLSVALYVDVVRTVIDKPIDFYFLFLSKANGEVKLFKASEAMIARGREKYLAAIEELKAARASGHYYHNEIQEIE